MKNLGNYLLAQAILGINIFCVGGSFGSIQFLKTCIFCLFAFLWDKSLWLDHREQGGGLCMSVHYALHWCLRTG